MTVTGTDKVWDLSDSSLHQHPGRRRLDLGGPIAVALAVVALAAAVADGVPLVTRWCLVASFGGVGMLVAISSLRRRQTPASLAVGLVGLVLPFVAVALALTAVDPAPAAVTNSTVQSSALAIAGTAPSPSPEFGQLPFADRAAATRTAEQFVFRLRNLHGSDGPYPTALASSDGNVVELSGSYRGLPIGVLDEGTHLLYAATADGRAFRITIVSNGHPEASVSVYSTLVATPSGV